MQSKAAFVKQDCSLLRVEILAPTLIKAILKFCATSKLFEFKNELI